MDAARMLDGDMMFDLRGLAGAGSCQNVSTRYQIDCDYRPGGRDAGIRWPVLWHAAQ